MRIVIDSAQIHLEFINSERCVFKKQLHQGDELVRMYGKGDLRNIAEIVVKDYFLIEMGDFCRFFPGKNAEIYFDLPKVNVSKQNNFIVDLKQKLKRRREILGYYKKLIVLLLNY